MDGLSGAASIFAVLSLAFQLAAAAQELKTIISALQDAPKQLDRLLSQLDQFSRIASIIKVVLSRQEERGFDVNSDIRQNIFCALQSCNEELFKMGEVVEKARKLRDGQTKLSRARNSIWLALKKEDIERFEARMAQYLLTLSVSLTLNMTWITFSEKTGPDLESQSEIRPINNLPFYDLSQETHHLVLVSESYWRHLTVDALKIYTKIYDACKDENEMVSLSALQRQFRDSDPILETLRLVWLRLTHSLEDTMSRNYTLALLYMLHVEKYLDERPKDDYGDVGIARKRRKSLKRFGDWVTCACDLKCGRSWNFANDLGLSQTVFPDRACNVFRWVEELDESCRASNRKGSYDYALTLKKWTSLYVERHYFATMISCNT